MTRIPAPVVAVMDVLQQCGWKPSGNHGGSEQIALSYDDGNLNLSAAILWNRWLQRVVSVSGFCRTPRTLAEVHLEMPERVASREQALAWIVHGIGARTSLATTPQWFTEGRDAQEQLPWSQDRSAYASRPIALVARDWMRVLGQQLRAEASNAAESIMCKVSYDGEALRFWLPHRMLLAQATGDAWRTEVTVRLSHLTALPTRWMTDPIDLSFWEGHLIIGNRRFSATACSADDLACSERSPDQGLSDA